MVSIGSHIYVRAKGTKLYFGFVDFEKAFHRVPID